MKKLIIIILIISSVFAQNVGNIFFQESTNNDMNSLQQNDNLNITSTENLTYTPIENTINPDIYILGPGDLLGINIISTKNISLPVRINPIGEIMIPSIGVLNVNDISLTNARIKISDYITKTFLQNAIINVTLLDIRRYKIQVLGAVHNPGFIYLTPVDKVYDALLQTGGVQKYAHPEIVIIMRGEKTIEVKLKEYISGRDMTQNVLLKPGDLVFVPFSDHAKSIGLTDVEYNSHQITVYGFVNKGNSSNSFQYYPGYTARDYIALAGGTKEQGSSFRSGNINKAIIYRSNGEKIKNAIDEIVQTGDLIEVPPSLLYQVVGSDGIIKTVTTIASIASSIYIIDSITNKN